MPCLMPASDKKQRVISYFAGDRKNPVKPRNCSDPAKAGGRGLPRGPVKVCFTANKLKKHPALRMSDTQDAVAEKERFELSNPFTGYTISSRAPSTKLGDFSRTLSGPGISIALSFPPVKVCPNVFMPPRSHELCLSRLRCFPCLSGRSPPRRASCPRCIGPPLPARSCPASHSPL